MAPIVVLQVRSTRRLDVGHSEPRSPLNPRSPVRPTRSPEPGPTGSPAAAIRRRGFSFVELLVVLVVIGILVGLAIPRYQAYKRRFYIVSMVTDLRNLAITEESYWNLEGSYSLDMAAIRFTNTPPVSITMVSADSAGWSARATYAGDSTICAIFYGQAPQLSPATAKNIIGCAP